MSTALRTYYRGHDLLAMRDEVAQTTRYYHFDHQGTTQCLTDSTGAVTDRFASDAWGVQVKRTGSSINRHWYIGNRGHYRSVAQPIDYIRFQHASVMQARFLTRTAPDNERGTENAYSYQGNSPGQRLPQDGRNASIYHLTVSQSGQSVVIDQCGGSFWKILWRLRDRNNRPPNPQSVLHGWIIQKVVVKGEVASCADEVFAFPDGCTYYEAWEVDIRSRGGGVVPIEQRDDYFGWLPVLANGARRQKPSQGGWTISGDAVFMQSFKLIPRRAGGTWERATKDRDLSSIIKKTNCKGMKAGNLWVTEETPAGFTDGGLRRVRHSLQMTWDCPCNRCRCLECEGSLSEPGRSNTHECAGCK